MIELLNTRLLPIWHMHDASNSADLDDSQQRKDVDWIFHEDFAWPQSANETRRAANAVIKLCTRLQCTPSNYRHSGCTNQSDRSGNWSIQGPSNIFHRMERAPAATVLAAMVAMVQALEAMELEAVGRRWK